jgi:hypothetical protein
MSQQWNVPSTSNPVGGYTNAAGTGIPDTMGGEEAVTPTLFNTSSTPLSIAFYWTTPSSDPITITYTYTDTNSHQASATAAFNVVAPTGVSVAVTYPGNTSIINPPFVGNSSPWPKLQFGGPGATGATMPGIEFLATTMMWPSQNNGVQNTGVYQWVQLVIKSVQKLLGNGGPGAATPQFTGDPQLDGTYPYGGNCLGQTPCEVITNGVLYNTAQDSPGLVLMQQFGEEARSFSAQMYLMWTPNNDSRCTGTGCTIPVPFGSITWQFQGDAVNTLRVVSKTTVSGTATFPVWTLNTLSSNDAGWESDTGFQPGNSFPSWQNTDTNPQ